MATQTTDADDYSAADYAAMEEALKLTLTEDDDPGRVEHVTELLAERPRIEVALFCCYHRQMQALRLKPWQPPPVWIDDVDAELKIPEMSPQEGRHDAARLLRRMIAHGVSQFCPDPIAAIEAAKA